MESHKKVLGILYVVLASIQILIMCLVSILFTTIIGFVMSQAEPKDAQVLELVLGILKYIPALVIIFLALPAMAAGIGLLAKKPWALVLALIIGCLNIFSFPIGTAIGVYTIWVYAEDNRLAKVTPSQP